MTIATNTTDARRRYYEHPFDPFRNVTSSVGTLLANCDRARSRLIPASAHMEILVVEDDADSADVLRRLLMRHEFTVSVAGCAAEARRACQEARFDMVICDIGLPDETGWTLMQDLRRRHGVNGIALTAYGAPADFAKSREAGFIAHLTKPLQVELLMSAIHGRE